jgi:hypothetical protein
MSAVVQKRRDLHSRICVIRRVLISYFHAVRWPNMAAVRIVPSDDDAEFPYAEALVLLQAMPGAVQEQTDIPPVIAAGKRFGWPQALIDVHLEYIENGKCFDFTTDAGLSCTLWEDNIFCRFHGAEHQAECTPIIEDLAVRLSCRVMRY